MPTKSWNTLSLAIRRIRERSRPASWDGSHFHFSCFGALAPRRAGLHSAALRNLLVVPGRPTVWVKRNPVLVNLIPGLGARHYHPSRLGWARSRIAPLQQTFSPRTMHPMPSPSPPRELCLPVSLSFSLTLVLHPLQRDRESIVGCGSENGMGRGPPGWSVERSIAENTGGRDTDRLLRIYVPVYVCLRRRVRSRLWHPAILRLKD